MICVFKNTFIDQQMYDFGKRQSLYVNVYRDGTHSFAVPYKPKTLRMAPPRPELTKGKVYPPNQRGQTPAYRIKVTVR